MTPPRSVVVARIALALHIMVTADFLRRQLGARATTLGMDLARVVDAAVQAQHLGYYPALDYFAGRPEVPPALLTTAEDLAKTVRNALRPEIQQHLIPFFSQVVIRRIISPAFTLPRISPQQADALEALARHYSPGGVRIDLEVSSVERGPVENLETVAARRALWNLRDHYEWVEVTDARVLAQ